MRVREISYSKKIGLPNYGSLGLTVTAELETNDAFDDVYQDLRSMVDEQIDGAVLADNHSNGNGRTSPTTHPSPPIPSPPLNPDVKLATPKQKELIQRLCKEQGRKAPVGPLSMAAASQLLNNMLEEENGTGSRSNGFNGYQPNQSCPSSASRTNSDGDGGGHTVANMTEGQRRYLYRLLSDQGLHGKDATDQLKSIFKVEALAQITKESASKQIEQMVGQTA